MFVPGDAFTELNELFKLIYFSVLMNIKGRIYSENWSMTYVEGDGILKCIKSAIKLAENDSIQSNEDCKKFVFEVKLA